MCARFLVSIVGTAIIIGVIFGVIMLTGEKQGPEQASDVATDEPPPPPKHWIVEMDAYHDFRIGPLWRVSAGGEPIEFKEGTGRRFESLYRLETERDFAGVDFTVEFETPGGWVRHQTVQEVDKERKRVRLRKHKDAERPQRFTLHVDNREGAAAVLRVGRCSRPVPANAYRKIEFFGPVQAADAVVYWNDKPRGLLFPAESAPEGLEAPPWFWFDHITLRTRPYHKLVSTYLVDPTASRKYRVHKQQYGGVSFGPSPKDTWDLKPRFLHALPALHYWQSPNPKAVPEDEAYARFSVIETR